MHDATGKLKSLENLTPEQQAVVRRVIGDYDKPAEKYFARRLSRSKTFVAQTFLAVLLLSGTLWQLYRITGTWLHLAVICCLLVPFGLWAFWMAWHRAMRDALKFGAQLPPETRVHRLHAIFYWSVLFLWFTVLCALLGAKPIK
jgi:hypothetical protein